MATPGSAAELVAATRQNFEKSGYDGVSEETTELNILKKKGCITPNQGGADNPLLSNSSYVWQIATTELSCVPWDSNAVANPTQTNIWSQPSVGIGGTRCVQSIGSFDEQRNSGPEQLIPMVKAKTEAMFYAVGKLLCQAFNDTGTATAGSFNVDNVVVGIPAAVVTSGSYANLSYATTPVFFGSGNNVLSGVPYNSFSSDPFPALAQAVGVVMRGDDWGKRMARPDVITIDFTNYEYLQAQVFQQVRMDVKVDAADMGFETLKWQGVHIIPSRFQSSGRMFVLNTKYIELRHMTGKLLQFKDAPSPVVQDIVPFQVAFGGNFLIKEPRYQAIVTIA